MQQVQQGQLFHESISDALREVVQVLGGPKAVGVLLKPELPADQAGQYVRDRLNPDRRERFSPDQLVLLAERSRQAGCHAIPLYFARHCGYADPQPLEPEDERARLQREYIDAVKRLEGIASGLRRVGVVREVA